MANIMYYIPNLTQEMGGIRQYAVALLKMLQQIEENQYFIYHDLNDAEVMHAISGRQEFTLVTSNDINTQKVVYKKVPIYRFNGIPVLGKLKFKRKFIVNNDLTAFCKEQHIQIIHCPYQYIPQVEGVKLITTLHDVQEIHFPEFFTAEERAYRAVNYLDFLRSADRVVVSYGHIKNDLIKYFNVPEDKIKVLLLKMEKLWFERFAENDIISIPGFSDSKKFLLYPANAWKHKNHLFLLDALAWVRDKFDVKINVVFTGNFNSENGKSVIDKSEQMKLENQVTFLGVVEENILYSLYKKAVGVVIPTLYEAGSFPLMESILLNVPVICSNVTSLPETIGNEKFVFDPKDINDISKKLIQFWNDGSFRKENLEQLSMQADKLRKNDSVPVLQNIYDDCCA